MLSRWPAFARFLEDGRICLRNNAAERALPDLAVGRKSWLFAGSQRGAERAALIHTLIQSTKLNELDPQAWFANVLARIAEIPQTRLSELLPWNWRTTAPAQNADRGLHRRLTLGLDEAEQDEGEAAAEAEAKSPPLTPRIFLGRSGSIFPNWASLSQNRSPLITSSFWSHESQSPARANLFMGPGTGTVRVPDRPTTGT
jgi:hypothetical protein